MNRIFAIGALALLVFAGWKLGGVMSSDALGLALGVIFGMMAGIPAALIAMSADRRVRHDVYHHHALQTTQKAAERISVLPVTNSARVPALANPGVAMLAQEARKRLDVEEFE